MPTQRKVRPGEHLTGIVDGLGLANVHTILSQPANESLRKRPHPEILNPGEILVVPDLEPLKFTLATGKRHKLTIERPKAKLRATFTTFHGEPSGATNAEITPENKPTLNISLDAGKLETKIAPACTQALIKVKSPVDNKPDIHWHLRLGYLVRPEGDEGALARLRNLGYYRVVVSEADLRERRAAIEEFQCDQGLALSGALDEDTKAKIEEVHGC
jgi:hypothetical protein